MHALGSSYLIRQSPGAEQYAGATVRIQPKAGETGTVDVRLTFYRDMVVADDDAGFLRESALIAVNKFAEEYGELSAWDIFVYDFAYHPIDTSSRTTYLTVYNALVSAFSTWRIRVSVQTDNRG